MNSIGAMSSPVKQPLPTVLAPPTISSPSPSKVQQPPNLTPLNLNTTSQSTQPLSLVNEHKNAPVIIPPPVITSVENVQKSTACNGIPDAKVIGEKIEEALPKIESQIPHSQVNNSVNIKNANEMPQKEALSDVKSQISEVENLSQKKDDKNNLPVRQAEKALPEVTAMPCKEPIKPEELPKSENIVAKPKEKDAKVNQGSTEIQTEILTNQGQTVSSEKIEQTAPNSSKVAVRRKREHKQLEEEDDEKKEKTLKKDTPVEEIKSKRTRLPTQPFQLTLMPEMHLISKIAEKSASSKINNDKLTVFYKNEFLAVRNEDGGFYLCQAMQNIHRASRRIRIRWLTQHPNDEFTPDFYDHTEFDCILTNITLKKIQKEQWKLPEKEKLRIENILKRSIDVEKGSEKPSVTEEHPDGLDVSLYKDEAQLTKKKGNKKNVSVKRKGSIDEQLPVKKSSRLSKKKPSYDFGHSSSESDENDDEDDNSNKKKTSIKKIVKKKIVAKEPAKKSTVIVPKPKTSSRKSQGPVKPTYVLASVSSALKKREITATKQKKENSVLEKKSSKKVEPTKSSPVVPLPSERSSKTRNAGNAVSAKITTAGIGVVKSNPKDRKTLRNRK